MAATSTGVVVAGAGAVLLAGNRAQGHVVGDMSAGVLISATDAGETERYWTDRRMGGATPIDQRADDGVRAASGSVARSKTFGGIPTLGALFFNNGGGDHYCTASVVHSGSHSLILTAAHCLHGGRGGHYARKIAFVPKYDRGRRPYGVWTVKSMTVHRNWVSKGDVDLDFGYAALNKRGGRTIEKAVGYNKLAINQGTGKWVNIAGYPKIVHDRRDHPIYCRTKTKRKSKYQIRMDCTGFYGGTSGSPWLLNYSGRTHTGYINGVIGGYQGGGSTASTSYSPYFDRDVYDLRTAADKRA
ncbi:trypsin-like serine peptidase [Actinomadura macrotermitis]|uniref:Peptidase S1 domain-containing protein n=1 Tax=Actinomadura macrotermitis TaxID=2585200 RepID=A0A7K0BNY5_9ACTN|nr:trypsin-like serine protease [Actinomadura macrotermitis]MQY02786.1 hypothetical protein [Actinomadura macrotermitis]